MTRPTASAANAPFDWAEQFARLASITQNPRLQAFYKAGVVSPDTPLEFVLSAPGYATTHIYRSPFPRSSNIVHLRPERMAEADKSAASVVTMSRPRGYLDPARDTMLLDGVAPPGVPPGAGGASAKVKPAGGERAISAEFNGERVTGRTWPASAGDVVVLELTY